MRKPYPLFGRNWFAYKIKDTKALVEIDVTQQEGDCPQGFSAPKRVVCPTDCGNSFVDFIYDMGKTNGFGCLEIRACGALLRGVPVIQLDNLDLLELSVEELLRLLRESPQEFKIQPENGVKNYFYRGREVMNIAQCQFRVKFGGIFETKDPKINRYLTYIPTHLNHILQEQGIRVIQTSKGVEVVADSPEHVRPKELLALEIRQKLN